MRRSRPPRQSPTPDWAPAIESDRREDRERWKVALSLAAVLHAGLFVVRWVQEETVLPPKVEAVIFPTTRVALKEKEPLPVVESERQPIESPVKIPVPAELLPAEPPAPEPDVPRFEPVPVAIPAVPTIAQAAIPDPPPVTEAPVRFRGDMKRPVRQSGAEPAYTEAARRVRERGVVILDAVIATDGRVTDLEVLKGLRFGLTEAAVAAVSGWRFEPATFDGRPIAVRYTLTVRFELR